MDVRLVDFAGSGKEETLALPDSFAARKFNAALAHQAACANFANARQGTRAQKTRAEVKHTTRKLFRQKGSGRARGGMSSSPIRRGGGRAFPSRPDENFKRKIPRQMYRAAMAVMFSQLMREGRIFAVKNLEMEKPKTKTMVERIQKMNISGRVILLVDTEVSENIMLSARNVPYLRFCRLSAMLPADFTADAVVMTDRALAVCAEKWS